MQVNKIQLGDKKVWPFTIPSGIITTQVSSLEKLAREVPELGVLTTKSIGPKPRAGNREPILAQYAPCCFVNAVGLTNPGVEEFSRELTQHNIPKDKFLLASIFGRDIEEFIYVARTLEDQVDGFELNLSCPHAKGYGMQLGQDPEIVRDITKAIVSGTRKPVFAKLTPNAGNIGEIAKSAVDAGAYGIVAINTVGPGYHSIDGSPVLTNKVGGLSGIGIIPIGLKCARDIRQAVGDNVPIIGMGGMRTVRDIEEYAKAGASVFGIGSGLAGMTDENIRRYFAAVISDLENGGQPNNSSAFLQEVDMNYRRVRIKDRLETGCEFDVFRTDESMQAEPGQFVFAWIPGVGEKPFSVMDDDPLTLGVQEVGEFTRAFNELKKGDSFYVRGPYGQGIPKNVVSDQRVSLVGGGCGIAGLYLLAKKFNQSQVRTFLGAKDKNHLLYLDEFREHGDVFIATEDGSLGEQGFVTDLFDRNEFYNTQVFFNCGPRAMIDAVMPLESKVNGPENIYSSVDYMTRCGVGVCGSCADPKGRRTCVEGPFMGL